MERESPNPQKAGNLLIPRRQQIPHNSSYLCRVSSRICRVLWLGSGSSPSTMALREVLSRPALINSGSSLHSSQLPFVLMHSTRKR